MVTGIKFSNNIQCFGIQWRIQGGPIRPCLPPSKLAMEFGPSWRKKE